MLQSSGKQVDNLSTIQSIPTSGNIALGSPQAGLVFINPGSNVIGCTVDVGSTEGQLVWIVNTSPSFSLTFSGFGSSHIKPGNHTIAALSAKVCVWTNSDGVGHWYTCL